MAEVKARPIEKIILESKTQRLISALHDAKRGCRLADVVIDEIIGELDRPQQPELSAADSYKWPPLPQPPNPFMQLLDGGKPDDGNAGAGE